MKARKRGTNDPFEEIDCLQFKNSYVLYKADMIEFENESKGNKPEVEYWEQLRHQAAIAAMQGILCAPIIEGVDPNPSKEHVAELAVALSDALVEQLNKKNNLWTKKKQ